MLLKSDFCESNFIAPGGATFAKIHIALFEEDVGRYNRARKIAPRFTVRMSHSLASQLRIVLCNIITIRWKVNRHPIAFDPAGSRLY